MQRFVLTAQGTGAGNVFQSFVEDPYEQALYTHHITGSPERSVLQKFESTGKRTQTSYRYLSTPTASIGHQGLSIAYSSSGVRWFFSSATQDDTNNVDKIRRFQVADSGVSDLSISNTGLITVFNGVGGGYATPTVSLDGQWMIVENSRSGSSAVTQIKVYDIDTVLDAANGADISDDYTYFWDMDIVHGSTQPLQGMASDGNYIYFISGDSSTSTANKLEVWTLDGVKVREVSDFTVGEATALADDTGTDAYEPEGLGWLWHNGRPMLAVLNASGDSGNRKNRIWILGGGLPNVGYGDGNRPAFISNGTNDFAVHADEVMRIGHYDPSSDTFTERASIAVSGAFDIVGALTKGSGSFKIDHPLKPDTHHLVHSFVEAPTADNLYRGVIQMGSSTETIDLDEVSRMSEGTFTALNTNTQVFVSNEDDWSPVRAKVNGSKLVVEVKEFNSQRISWLVVGERKDQHMLEADWTDEQGRVIVEPEKT